MPSSKKLGTLVVVVLKARHLKDSHTFYKQDPYALIRLGKTSKQTKVDHRGGQHPVWDEEFHLPVFEVNAGIDQQTLKVSVYSKESKVDDLIGEGTLDVTETLRKGEFDDWVKLELNGSYGGEVYLEMTYYSADPPLVRRPSKLSPKDRLWRPPPPPPKDEPSPSPSPRPSPRLSPQVQPSASNSPRLRSSSSPRLHPTALSPAPHHQDKDLPPAPLVSPPQQTYVHPTLKNIPFLDVGPSASGSRPDPPLNPAQPAPALYSVPSILRPRNVRSSPIPVPARDGAPLPTPPRHDDPSWRLQQELAGSDPVLAARLAQQGGGIDVERLRAEQADVDLAKRIAREEGGAGAIPGGWVE